ncbi:MAG: response regulator transcription factor [Myxococcota bacterium]
MNETILIVDDEARIRDVVQYALERESYRVLVAEDGAAALTTWQQVPVDLIVLDIMLPERDGLDVCRRIRESGSRTPVLFLSARGDEVDRVVGLELGGDDYLTKPFSPRELVARVRAVLRRAQPEATQPPAAQVPAGVVYGPLRVDVSRHEVSVRGVSVILTATELGILAALLERPGVVLSRGQLLKRAYAYDNLITERTIDTHVRRIRAKCRPHDFDPIATVYGVGYKIAPVDGAYP